MFHFVFFFFCNPIFLQCYFFHPIMLQNMVVMVYPDGIKYNKNFINNTWHDSTSGDTYPIYNHSTGDKICDVAMGNEKDVDKAVATAHNALQPGSPWHTMEASQRGHLLNKLADLIERYSEYLADLETLGNRRPLPTTYLPRCG